MGKAIGIDLGTTNSCAAILQDGRPRIITSRGGASTIPSVFAVNEKGEELVGHEAKRQAQLNPQRTVMGAKRLIGRNFHSKTIEKVRQVFTYELMEGESSEVLIKVNDRVYTLEQISAAILLRIKTFAEEVLGETVDRSVITVPAYFNDRQRQAVRVAGQLAGFKVLRVLNEPTAAALAYGLGRTLTQRIAVYDLGGGTFDISVIDIKDRIFEVTATGGDTFLGGVDFDGRIMQWILEKFHDRFGVDLSWDRVAIQRIRDAAETAKIELSSLPETRIHIPFITRGETGPLAVDERLDRETLELLTGDLVERTLATCERIFREASTTKEQIDEILLVGGQSRMPLVQRRVAEMLGRAPCKGVHPDEAVAIGAAIMAHSLSERKENDVTLLDVLPMPIGINKVDGTMHVLFPKNHPLPDRKRRTLTTNKDGQQSIMLRIYQGESRMVLDNELLGTFVFSGIRPAPKGTVRVEVFFYIDSEGILNLSARDEQTGHQVTTTLKVGKRKDNERAEPPKPAAQDAVDTLDTASTQPSSAPPPTPAPLRMPTPSMTRELSNPTAGPARPRTPRPAQAAKAPSSPNPKGPPNRPAGPRPARPGGPAREGEPARPRRRRPPGREGAPATRERRPAAGDTLPSSAPAQVRRPYRPRPNPPGVDQPPPPSQPPRLETRPPPGDSTILQRVAGWFKRLFGR
ncbi:MAG: Hsp70 family protein [Deltaproteobacteria bacterium]|nr:Hsp70 family protein [Deltaproteobacteria bacterium]